MNFFNEPTNIIVEKRKVIDYLLNVAHPDNTGKAKLLISYGFHPENWEDFAESVIAHAVKAGVNSESETPFGRK